MFQPARITLAVLCATLAACGSGTDRKQDEHKVMKPEQTVFRDYVTAPRKVEDQVDKDMAEHRDALEQRLREDEGGSPGDAKDGDKP